MTEPYFRDDLTTIHHGEAAALVGPWLFGSVLEGRKVDLLLTDSPYSSGGMMRGDRTQGVHSKYVQSGTVAGFELPSFSGDNRDQLAFLFWCSAWIGGILPFMAPGGIGAFFTDWRQLPATCIALQSGGFVFRGIAPWVKPAARPVQNRWTNSCEYVVWGTAGPREMVGDNSPGFFQCSPPSNREHITQKPVAILREMIRIVPPGGLVFDPFCGSGSTLVAAREIGRESIGIEMDEHQCVVAARRVRETIAAPRLFDEAAMKQDGLFDGSGADPDAV